MIDEEVPDDLQDDGPDVDLINDAARDDRLMREAEVEAGKLCSTCQRGKPVAGMKICASCKADEEREDTEEAGHVARVQEGNSPASANTDDGAKGQRLREERSAPIASREVLLARLREVESRKIKVKSDA